MSTEIRRMSPEARERLKQRERLRTTPYRDVGGSMAIGYGVNEKSHPEVFAAIKADPTKEGCEKGFDIVMDKMERGLQRNAPNYHECSQGMTDALLMRSYNAGVRGALKAVKEPMQAGDWKEVARRMGNTCSTHKDGGSLAKIRKEEQDMFTKSMGPEPESAESNHHAFDSDESNYSDGPHLDGPEFDPHFNMPFARFDLGQGWNFGAGLDDSGTPRFQVGFNCRTM